MTPGCSNMLTCFRSDWHLNSTLVDAVSVSDRQIEHASSIYMRRLMLSRVSRGSLCACCRSPWRCSPALPALITQQHGAEQRFRHLSTPKRPLDLGPVFAAAQKAVPAPHPQSEDVLRDLLPQQCSGCGIPMQTEQPDAPGWVASAVCQANDLLILLHHLYPCEPACRYFQVSQRLKDWVAGQKSTDEAQQDVAEAAETDFNLDTLDPNAVGEDMLVSMPAFSPLRAPAVRTACSSSSSLHA